MIADTLHFLHTTDAYQAAALELMAGEANFAARQLDFGESIAPNTVTTNRWRVSPPPYGIGGTISSANYTFEFSQGRLLSVQKIDWLKKSAPPLGDLLDLAKQSSLLDTNSAYELAKRKLASILIDVEALENKFPPSIFQVPARRRDEAGNPFPGVSNNVAVPLFMIGWGKDSAIPLIRERMRQFNRPMPPLRPSPFSSVFIKLLGTTKEVVELHVRDCSFSKRPLLQLTNAAELLGPLPPRRHFVEALVGGTDAYETISKPEKVEAWLLTSGKPGFKRDRAGPAVLTTPIAAAFSDALLDFESYHWYGDQKLCVMDEGARLRFTRDADRVDFRLCYECDMLSVSHNGKSRIADFDHAHNALVMALQAAFPDDIIVKGLQLHGSKQ